MEARHQHQVSSTCDLERREERVSKCACKDRKRMGERELVCVRACVLAF
jgi:hypothetical protein